MPTVKEYTCVYCNAGQCPVLYKKNNFEIIRCKNCGLVYVANPPSREELVNLYDKEYFMGNPSRFGYINYFEEENNNAVNQMRIANNINKYAVKGKILDVGCATGNFLRLFGNNWERYGIDISKYISSYAKEIPECRIFEGELAQFPHLPESFDVITLLDALDHMIDPIANLGTALRFLKRNGMIVITCGDSDSLMAKVMRTKWHLCIPPTHLFFFSRKVLSNILSSNGLKIKKIDYSGKWVSLKLCFFRLSYISSNSLFKVVYSFLKKHTLFGNLRLYYNFRDVMTIYAEKT